MMYKRKSYTIFPFLLIIVSMFCLAYASVPLYRIFCKVTGYGGTVNQKYIQDDIKIGKKDIKVRFNADINPHLPWSFKSEINNVIVKTGERKLMFYYAENLSSQSVDGMAVYNVTPHKAGKYFNKIACFCFTKQTLLPYQKAVMPVSFFIDPDIEDDPETQDVEVITLSYTFFPFKE